MESFSGGKLIMNHVDRQPGWFQAPHKRLAPRAMAVKQTADLVGCTAKPAVQSRTEYSGPQRPGVHVRMRQLAGPVGATEPLRLLRRSRSGEKLATGGGTRSCTFQVCKCATSAQPAAQTKHCRSRLAWPRWVCLATHLSSLRSCADGHSHAAAAC